MTAGITVTGAITPKSYPADGITVTGAITPKSYPADGHIFLHPLIPLRSPPASLRADYSDSALNSFRITVKPHPRHAAPRRVCGA